METQSTSVLSVPAPEADGVALRLRPISPPIPLRGPRDGGWWDIDLRTLGLADGAYEYEFEVDRGGTRRSVVDPYAEELSDGPCLRAVMHLRQGRRVRPAFSWEGELPPGGLPGNNELVMCELPLRQPERGDGRPTLEGPLLDEIERALARSGVNCIQMLPIQDSPDQLNGGYGTRFFFAPDRAIGSPAALRRFIKRCHQRGIRVIMDLVMNHAHECPLRDLAFDWFFLRDGAEEPDRELRPRPAWGGDVFRYRTPQGGRFHAREFQYQVAAFFIEEYHVDGFRIDEFKGIDNYEFIQTLTDRAHALQDRLYRGQRPFVVIGEDSGRRIEITTGAGYNGRRVVDAVWDFGFRDEIRRLVSDPMPEACARRLLGASNAGFSDLANRVAYCTSHDVPPGEENRLLPYYLGGLDGAIGRERTAKEMLRSTFALMLTAAGIPMFLAGEESAREESYGIPELIRLRAAHPALRRNELEFLDVEGGEGVLAYCRTGGKPPGCAGQVIVIANCGVRDSPTVEIVWPWAAAAELREIGGSGGTPSVADGRARLGLRAHETRVFTVEG